MNEQELTQAPPASTPLATPAARVVGPELLRAWRAFYPDWRDPYTTGKHYEDHWDATTLAALARVLEADRRARGNG